MWLSIWSEVQIVASFESGLVLFFWYWLAQVVLSKRPLNGCITSSMLVISLSYYLYVDSGSNTACAERVHS